MQEDQEKLKKELFDVIASGRGTHPRRFQKLFESANIDVDITNQDGNSLLIAAIFADNLEIIHWLIGEKQANVNFRGDAGKTPLHVACTYGDVDYIVLLVENKANID